jgi:4-diphosphocytidyl-2-C-methyl-D-erythritol kinase
MTGVPGRSPGAGRRVAPVIRLAPAKLNLTLAVVGRRADGYHELHSVMVPLALADVISLAPAPIGPDTIHVDGYDPGPPADNLVLRALAETRRAVGAGWGAGLAAGDRVALASAAALASEGGGAAPALAVRLDKRIPVAAGLAGGSSDAAAAIDGALEAWSAELDGRTRQEVATRLGSDVPFFLAGGTALVEGRGERLTPLRGIVGRPPGVLLVTPDVGMSTAAVFAAYAAGARPPDSGATRATSAHLAAELERGLTAGRLFDRAGILASANDLAAAASAVLPELTPFRRALSRLLGRPIGLSGSGPTCWALYPSLEEAATAADTVRTAVSEGRIVVPGEGRPSVVATSLATAPATREES